MTDPLRWCDDASSANELERDVLRSDLEVEPPANVNAVVWGKLAAELGLGSALVGVATAGASSQGAAGTAQGAAAATSHAAKALLPAAGSSLAFVQGLVVGVLACGAIWAGMTMATARDAATGTSSPSKAPVDSHDAPVRPSANEAEPLDPPQELRAERVAPRSSGQSHTPAERSPGTEASKDGPVPSVATFGEVSGTPGTTSQDHRSELKEEAALLRRARAELRAGELGRARTLLDESKRRFAAPELYQEREALLIELLARSGQTAAAAARARAFLISFPESPHADRLRAFANP